MKYEISGKRVCGGGIVIGLGRMESEGGYEPKWGPLRRQVYHKVY